MGAKELEYVVDAHADLAKHTLTIEGDLADKEPSAVAEALTLALKPHGYTVSVDKTQKQVAWSEFQIAVPAALAFAILFVLLQKLGIVDLANTGAMTYGSAFIIGIIASLSTCMAVVGGLVLSISATFVKGGNRVQPQMLFHVGRLASFFILGGVIGSVGSAFTLSTTATTALSVLVAIVMLILGINLLDVVHWSKQLMPRTPKFISRHAVGLSQFEHTLMPFLIGAATFILPCGFTQSLQLYALSTGSFMSGALTMTSFALGTFPVLALLSFTSYTIVKPSNQGIFFKTAGIVVILFALYMVVSALAAADIIDPLFTI